MLALDLLRAHPHHVRHSSSRRNPWLRFPAAGNFDLNETAGSIL